MRKIRVLGTAVAIVAALALTTGCSKDGASGGSSGAAAVAKVGFKVFPSDFRAIGGFSLASVRNSASWPTFKESMEKAMTKEADAKKALDACGFNPVLKVNHIIAAGNPDTEKFAVVVNGISRADAKKCIEGIAAAEKEDIKIEDSGKLMKVFKGETKVHWSAWLDDNTVLISDEGEEMKAWLEARLAATEGIEKNAELSSLMKSANSKNNVWFAMVPTAKEAQPMAMALGGGQAKGFYGSLDFSSGLKVDLGIRTGSGDDAAKAKDAMESMSKMLAGHPLAAKYLPKVVFGTADSDVKVNVDLTESDLKDLEKELKSLSL